MTDDDRIARIEQMRFARGRTAALDGAPPTEANAAYQRGYMEGVRARRTTR